MFHSRDVKFYETVKKVTSYSSENKDKINSLNFLNTNLEDESMLDDPYHGERDKNTKISKGNE